VLSCERLNPLDVESHGGVRATARHLRSLAPTADSVTEVVRDIIAAVRTGGDAALRAHTMRLDTAGTDPGTLLVPDETLERSLDALEPGVRAALEQAIANVMTVCQAQVSEDHDVVLAQGQVVRLREVPVQRAAVYVPGGRAPYPSTVVMGVVAARAAGVIDVVVCAPPGPDGEVNPLILGASRLCGAAGVYRMGGAQAIAALAYGTESVPAVDVIVGPGNLYVQEAKRQVSGVVGIDGFAGPSDLLVIAGPDAPAHLVALDLLAQAEHGPESLVVAVSRDAPWLDQLADWVERYSEHRPTATPAACVLVQTADAHDAFDLADEFAPEHLQLVGAEAEALAPRVRRAGCVLVGWPSGTAFGDYIAGSNHVLPTGGAARFGSALGPRHFRRRMSEVHVGGAAAALAVAALPLAQAEGFPVHAESMRARAPVPEEESDGSQG
jgi:histidinol dehydrogenase